MDRCPAPSFVADTAVAALKRCGAWPLHRPQRPLRAGAAVALAALLVACAAPHKSAPPPPEPAPVAEPVAAVAPPPPPPSAPLPPVSQSLQQQANKIALLAVDQLQAGNEDQAKAELQRALATDPNSKLALSLQRQMTADPQATLGRESFSYTVKPGETLSKIAGRFMNDIYAFYILARYNDIKVPRLVAGGQTLRIPGKAPPPGAIDKPVVAAKPPAGGKDKGAEKDNKDTREADAVAAPPTPAPEPVAVAVAVPTTALTPGQQALAAAQTAERNGDLDRALAEYRRAGSLDQPSAATKAGQVQKQLVARHTGNARRASAKQDLTGAIASWDKVLELDADNQTAKLERQKAVDLKKKLDAF